MCVFVCMYVRFCVGKYMCLLLYVLFCVCAYSCVYVGHVSVAVCLCVCIWKIYRYSCRRPNHALVLIQGLQYFRGQCILSGFYLVSGVGSVEFLIFKALSCILFSSRPHPCILRTTDFADAQHFQGSVSSEKFLHYLHWWLSEKLRTNLSEPLWTTVTPR